MTDAYLLRNNHGTVDCSYQKRNTKSNPSWKWKEHTLHIYTVGRGTYHFGNVLFHSILFYWPDSHIVSGPFVPFEFWMARRKGIQIKKVARMD